MLGLRLSLAWSIAMLAGGWLVASALAVAAQGAPPTAEIFPLPNPSIPSIALNRPPRTHGLSILVDATACVGIGYCPIEVKVSAASATSNTRRFTVRITRSGFRGLAPIQVSADLELPAGETTASTVLHMPQFIREQQLSFDFWDEGEHLPDLSVPLILSSAASIRGAIYDDEQLPPSILFPNNEGLHAPDIDSWQRALVVQRNTQTDSYSPLDLPDSSIDYSSWDVVLISLDELTHIVRARPKCWTAMRQWVAAGGNLWVYGVGEPFRRLRELEKLLDWPLAKVPEARRMPADVPGWRGVDARIGDVTESIIQQATTPPYYSTDPALAAAMAKERPGLRKRLQGLTFVKRRLGMGTVVALDTSTPMTEHQAYWDLLKFDFPDRDQWHDRHGLSFLEENPGFWNFLIPGVGLAPIGTFEVLITLFVVGIGPVNYFLLRRRHKQSLLMLTVPAGAAVVTGCLLLYAVFADGFAVRARARSFTEIDQHQGDAACWSRIAYYAGITPSKGLEFASDTAVYPIAASSGAAQSGLSSGRQVEEGSPRRFVKGWLPARTVTQLLTVRARTTSARLEITPAVNGHPSQLTNRLGTRIEQLLVVGEDGKCGWAESVAIDGAAKLDPLDPAIASDRLAHSLFTHQLQYPPAWTGGNSTSGVFGVGWRSRVYSSGNATARMIGTLLEHGLAAIQEVGQLPPRTYVAVVERSPEFELGLEHANSEASFHVILGHW